MLASYYSDFVTKRWIGTAKKANTGSDLAGLLLKVDFSNPTPDNFYALKSLFICATGLGGESGESLEKLKKRVRDGKLDRDAILRGLGDQLFYITALAIMLGSDLSGVIEANVEKLEDRAARGVMHGEGDYR
jgi:NTP pyrophosphatase (non-canonical NTP hydrolase)